MDEARELRERATQSTEETTKDVQADAEASSASVRRMNTCLKTIAAMAIDGYGWDPSKRGPTAGEIASATQKIGAPVSEDTIRSVLQKAKEFIDPEAGKDA